MKMIDTITWPFKTASSSPKTPAGADQDARSSAADGGSSPGDGGSSPADAPAPSRSGFGAARAGLRRMIAALSPVAVDAARRRHLAGLIFVGAGTFVEAVARALEQYPDLSPLPGITPASLRRRQARAFGWLQLRAALSRALAGVADNYVYEQGLAVEEALQVVQALRSQQQVHRLHGAWPPAPGLEERRVALGPALAVLAERNHRKRDVRTRTARALAQAAGKPKQTRRPARKTKRGKRMKSGR